MSNQTPHLRQRGSMWQFFRRVPCDFAQLDRRGLVVETTKIKISEDPKGRRAARVADAFNQALEAYWLGLSRGDAHAAQGRYEEARRRARTMGFDYVDAEVLSQDQVALQNRLAFLERTLLALQAGHAQAPRSNARPPAVTAGLDVDAGLGLAPKATILLSQLVETFKDAKRVEIRAKSEDQVRKWENPLKRAVNNMITITGDRDLSTLTRDDAVSLREWWEDRIMEEDGHQPETANKDFTHLQSMIKVVTVKKRWDLDTRLFADLRFKKQKNGTEVEGGRQPFSDAFIAGRLLADGAFGKLNAEARRILYVMVESGMRPSEIVNLRRPRVKRLDTVELEIGKVTPGDILYVEVRGDGRELKTDNSLRDMPLLGVSRAAIEAQLATLPADEDRIFPNYHDNADSWSALVNQYLRNNDLVESNKHTTYSLRHAFKDRMLAAEMEEEMRDMMMGHVLKKENYGNGTKLMQKHRWLTKMMFPTFPRSL